MLCEFTGENFDPYADVWAQWWEDHKEEFQSKERVKGGKNARPPSDAHFYGLPVKSDRILFIIDTSELDEAADEERATPPRSGSRQRAR